MLLDKKLLDTISAQAKASPRLRMNYNLHESLDSKAQRLFNALEPGTKLPIHRHKHTDETYILIKGKLNVTFLDDTGSFLSTYHLDPLVGNYGIQIPKGTWHSIDVLESSVIFEVKDGPYCPIEPEDVLNVDLKG